MPSRRAFLSGAGSALAASTIPARIFAQTATAVGSAGKALVQALNGTDADLGGWLETWVAPAAIKRNGEQAMLSDLLSLRKAGTPFAYQGESSEGPFLVAQATVTDRHLQRGIALQLDRNDRTKVWKLPELPWPARYNGSLERPASDAALRKALDERMDFSVQRDEFSGSIAVRAPDGRLVFERSAGLADRDKHERNTPRHRFHLGSQDKSFTALMIAQLAEEKTLTLSDTIARWIPEYANKAFAAKVTIEQLLSHQSGLGDLWSRPSYRKDVDYQRMLDLLPAIWDEEPAFQPGSKASYSNEGFIVLGAIIEKAANSDWFTELNRRIYARADMPSTAHLRTADKPRLVALPYRLHDGDVLAVGERYCARQPGDSIHGNSCGGGHSTARDMTAYLHALWTEKLISKTMVDLMSTPHPGGLGSYGLGFETEQVGGRRVFGHGGGGPFSGVDGKSAVVWETGWAYSVLGNYDAPYGGAMSRDIAKLLASI